MFKDNDDVEFAKGLLHRTILRREEYNELIQKQAKNWEFERIAFMDLIIMQAALAELTGFPTIPVNVTLNEYIEIAKQYSTEKSGTFINGILDGIITALRKEKKLLKN
jgi:N utilization substance protein B